MHTTNPYSRLALLVGVSGWLLAGTALPLAAQSQQPPPASSAAPAAAPTNGSNGPTTGTAARTATRKKDYQLVPGDKLRIEVYKDPQLSQSLQVRPDGKITLPLVGDVDAAGLTPLVLRDQLTTALKEYITNPVVTVIVVEAQPTSIYVVGEVNSPGAIPLGTSLTVLQALALAGGLKDFANVKNIRVLRNGLLGVQTIPFNYRDALEGIGAPVYVNAGDTVVVPN
jgi:polysaccharide export outer membrane protein